MPSHHESQLTHLLLQMGRGSSTPSRELINHVLGDPERINDTAEVLSLPAQTLLHRSVSLGQNAVSKWLVMKGADINAVDGDGKTPLDHATTGEHKELVNYLRSKGAFSATDRFIDNLDGAVTDMVDHTACATINIGQAVDQTVPATDLYDIGMAIDTVENATMKGGEGAFIFYLSITNNQSKQVRVELPFSTYVTAQNEEVEQDVWLAGLIIGGKGATIRAGAHKKIGLVFYQTKLPSISIGDQLHVLVELQKTPHQYDFTFRCTNQAMRKFALADTQMLQSANIEEQNIGIPNGLDSSSTEIIERFNRIEVALAATLAGQSTGLDAIAKLQHHSTKNTEAFTAELAELRQLIDRIESRFEAFSKRVEMAVKPSDPAKQDHHQPPALSIERFEQAIKSLFSGQLASTQHIAKKVDFRSDESISLTNTLLVELQRLSAHGLLSLHAKDEPMNRAMPNATTTGVVNITTLLTQLVELGTIPIAELRVLLLPLDLMPSAVIDDINERALDLIGEPALVEEGDTIIVQREVLLQVIAS